MPLREIFYNVYVYAYLILVIGSSLVYAFNYNNYKEDSKLCASYYEDESFLFNPKQITLMYWKENDMCCHYDLNDENNIVQKCN